MADSTERMSGAEIHARGRAQAAQPPKMVGPGGFDPAALEEGKKRAREINAAGKAGQNHDGLAWTYDPDTGMEHARDAGGKDWNRVPLTDNAAALEDRRHARERDWERVLEPGSFSLREKTVADLEGEQLRVYGLLTAPDGKIPDAIIEGSAGTGKTLVLLLALRHWHFSGRHVKAARMAGFKRAQEGVFGPAADEAMDPYLLPAVLLLDDLGSGTIHREQARPHELEVLLEVHNARNTAGRATWFTSNLVDADLDQRYSGAVTSRLTDVRGAVVENFTGLKNHRWEGMG